MIGKNNIISISKKLPSDFTQNATRDVSLLTSEVFLEIHRKGLPQLFGCKFTAVFMYYHKDHVGIFRSPGEYRAFSRTVAKKFISVRNFAIKSATKLTELSRWLYNFVKRNLQITDFIAHKKNFIKHYIDFFVYHQAVQFGANYLSQMKFTALNKNHINFLMSKLGNAYKYNEMVVPVIEKYFKKLLIGQLLLNEVNQRLTRKLKLIPKNRSLLLYRNNVLVLSNKEAMFLRRSILKQSQHAQVKIKIIKGFSAYRGKVTGRVRRVVNLYQLREVHSGEILVTIMTRPQYNQYFGKLKAIVTDEGGILSHAAIVSRELKIPCIVGTKIATQIFKNGDQIEVDANKGIVKKNMKKVILKHIMTRPVTVPAMVGWFIGVGEFLERRCGIGMREHFVLYRDGVVRSYRSQRQLSKVRRYILRHPERILEILKQAKMIYIRFKLFSKRLNAMSIRRHPQIINDFFHNYLESWEPNFFAFWVPQLVKRRELGKYGKEIFSTSAAVRKFLDPLVYATHFYQRVIELINKEQKVLQYCSSEELYAYLNGDLTLLEKKNINKRARGWLLYQKQSWYVHGVNELRKIVRRFGFELEEDAPLNVNTTTVAGTVAYRGKMRGTVRLLYRYEDNEKVKKGEIIVSPMTTPAFMPALIKCGGIVTDEGSITCHAAIVSRELGIPCVIGTRIATKVLKDGDKVSVDAERGVVKKITTVSPREVRRRRATKGIVKKIFSAKKMK